jgi:hypothetical protein
MFKPNLTTKFVLNKIAHKLVKTLKRGTRQCLHFPKLESHRLKNGFRNLEYNTLILQAYNYFRQLSYKNGSTSSNKKRKLNIITSVYVSLL